MKISIGSPGNKWEFIARELSDISELKELILKYPYSLGIYRKNHRKNKNFISTELIGLDFDEGVSIESAVEMFKDVRHIIAPTKSHRVEKNGKVCDRFRVILFLSQPITDVNTYESTWYSLYAKYPNIDKACKDPARYFDPSTSIFSERLSDGLQIDPVFISEAFGDETPKTQDLSGVKGDLGKRTLQFLTLGAPKGQRHTELYAAARDCHQNLYPKEWFINQVQSLARNTGDYAFVDKGALQAIDDAYSVDPKHEPRLVDEKPRAFSYTKLGDLLDKPDITEDWLVDGLLLRGGVSLIVGVPKIGKTTLVRQLEKCILRGENFLDRKSIQGVVLHYSFDEKPKTAKRHYKKLGLTNQDPMFLHFGSLANEQYITELEEDLLNYKPALVVIDTLFDMVDAEDINSYAPIKRALTVFNTLAEKTNAHIMFIHHQNKPNAFYSSGSGHSVLGSTAIFGSVDCLLMFEQAHNSHLRMLSAKGRAIDDFQKTYLEFDKVKMIYLITDPPREVDF